MQMLLRVKMESSKARASRSMADSSCKKHPKHRQSPGVCSICLSEKLSQLANSDCSSSSSRTARSRSSSSSSLSSYVSSISSSRASSDASPAAETDARNSVRVFRKSRSMAVTSNKIGIAKGGFWSKLLSGRKSKNGGLMMHSRTTRERVAAAGIH